MIFLIFFSIFLSSCNDSIQTVELMLFFISFYPVNRLLLEQMHKLDDIPKNEIWKNIHKFAEQMQVE